jgi:FKBP-type peptidyl-prolyl cis-trans isomerase
MKRTRHSLFFLILFFSFNKITAQHSFSIPAFTGYATPLEKETEDGDSELFNEKTGVVNWHDKNQQLHYYFYLKHAGQLNITLFIKNKTAGNKLNVKVAGKTFLVAVPQSATFAKVKTGTVNISTPGFYEIEISSAKATGNDIADIQSIELSGSAAQDMHSNSKPRRNAASVHLVYPLADTVKAIAFYNEITVPEHSDQLYTYFMACGFSRGYFGMQVNSETERRIIFSVWDAGNEAVDRNKVNDENRVKLFGKGNAVIASDFGNEGTGGHSHFIYNWKTGTTYKFYVTALPDSASNSTIYSGYFFIPELQKWKLIASFRSPKDGKYLSHLYSFLEDFDGTNGNVYRKANYGNQWIRTENGDWKALTTATFSCDATGKALDRIDFGGGMESNSFYLWNGGFKNTNTAFGERFERVNTNEKPTIDLYKNSDSVFQTEADQKLIFESIAAGKSDTTGSINGVFYKILKEGDGDFVNVNDTLTVNYKGWILNGETFDATKDKPVTFPLNKLIKGWQYGLTKCRKGGKIRLMIPSALGYSIRARAEKIPPNSILVFEIEVLDIKKPM